MKNEDDNKQIAQIMVDAADYIRCALEEPTVFAAITRYLNEQHEKGRRNE